MGDRRSRDRRDYYGYEIRSTSPHKSRHKSPSPNRQIYREYSPDRNWNSPIRAKAPSPNRQDANKRNLHVWGQWRTEVNENLISDFFYTTNRRDRKQVQPLETLIKDRGVYEADGKVDQTRGLLNYSLSTNRVTDLGPNDFLRYGIPRAKINSANKEYRKLFSAQDKRSSTMDRRSRPRTANSPSQHHQTNATSATLNRRELNRYDEEPRSVERQQNGRQYRHSNVYSNMQSEQTRSGATFQRNYVDPSLPRASNYQESQFESSKVSKDHFTPRTDYSRGDTAREERDGPSQNDLYSTTLPTGYVPPAPPPPPVPPPPPPLPNSLPLPYKPKPKQEQLTSNSQLSAEPNENE